MADTGALKRDKRSRYSQIEVESAGLWPLHQVRRIKVRKFSPDELVNNPPADIDALAGLPFEKEMEIFDAPRDAHVGPTIFGFMRIWPGWLEDHLQRHTEERFGDSDGDTRALINDLVELFLHNLRWNIVWKRIFHTVSAISAILLAWAWSQSFLPAWAALLPGAPEVLGVAAGVVTYVLAAYFVCYQLLFSMPNWYLFTKCYRNALRLSAQQVSESVKDRMVDIWTSFSKLSENLESRRATGEAESAGNGRLWTQMQLWLALRVDAIEHWLKFELHEARRRHAFLDFFGMLATFAIATVLMLVIVVTLGLSLTQGLASLMRGEPVLQDIFTATLFVAAGVHTLAVSGLTYFHRAWNSAADILDAEFDVSTWHRFTKFQLHETLGRRTQSAFQRISELNEQLKR